MLIQDYDLVEMEELFNFWLGQIVVCKLWFEQQAFLFDFRSDSV